MILMLFDNSLNEISNYKTNKSSKYSNKFFVIAVIIIYLFSAVRFDVGWDYKAYYDTIRYNIQTNIVSNEEYLTYALVFISQRLQSYEFYFYVNSFLVIYLTIKTINKYSDDKWISLIWFLCFPLFYLNSLSVVRMFTAISIVFYAFTYLENKKIFKYIFSVLVASLFHKSAIIALLFYLLNYIKLKKIHIVSLALVSPFLSSLVNRLIRVYLPNYAIYTASSETTAGRFALLFLVVIGMFGLFFRTQIIKGENKRIIEIYYNLYYIGVIVFLMFFQQGTMGHRLSIYGTYFSLLLLPKIVMSFKENERLYVRIVIIIVSIISFIYTIYVGAETYIPYRTIWHF